MVLSVKEDAPGFNDVSLITDAGAVVITDSPEEGSV